jgi:hypothetical protein
LTILFGGNRSFNNLKIDEIIAEILLCKQTSFDFSASTGGFFDFFIIEVVLNLRKKPKVLLGSMKCNEIRFVEQSHSQKLRWAQSSVI